MDEDNVTTPSYRKSEKTQKEGERRKSIMKERDKLRNWDLDWGNQTRVQIVGDSNLVVNWVNGRWKINNQTFVRPMSDHMDLF